MQVLLQITGNAEEVLRQRTINVLSAGGGVDYVEGNTEETVEGLFN